MQHRIPERDLPFHLTEHLYPGICQFVGDQLANAVRIEAVTLRLFAHRVHFDEHARKPMQAHRIHRYTLGDRRRGEHQLGEHAGNGGPQTSPHDLSKRCSERNGWVSRPVKTRRATKSPNAGPSLNPWPDPPPTSQTLSALG